MDYFDLMADLVRDEARELGAMRGMRDYNGNPVPDRCAECGMELVETTMHSPGGGYYVGTWCKCGPYSRNSGYYRTAEEIRR
jgi:hypothetical protein